MSQKYVDKLTITVDGRDISDFCANAELDDALSTLSTTFTFETFQNPHDKYVPKLEIAPGQNIVVTNHGNELFQGKIYVVDLDGTVTAYTQGWYLNKSQLIFQCVDLPADQAVRQLCSRAGIAVGDLPSLPTPVKQLWVGDTAADILNEIIDLCQCATGKRYVLRVDKGKLHIRELSNQIITAYHKPAENVAAFDITWALGNVTGEDSAEELRNSILIAAEEDGKPYVGATASNSESIKQFGMVQYIETVTTDPGTAQLHQSIENLIQKYDRLTATRTIEEIWGADEVISGCVLSFNSPQFGLKGPHRVTRVTHTYNQNGHTMRLEVEALEQPRAVPECPDSIKVPGLPAKLGQTSSSTTITLTAEIGPIGGPGRQVNAVFSAYYPSDDPIEGGFKDAWHGAKLDPSQHTCAGPKQVPFGTKITVQGTGTALDGVTYTVTDRGGAIKIDSKGRYHFDLLMSSYAECERWGMRNGIAIIHDGSKGSGGNGRYGVSTGSTGSGSCTAAQFIAVAASQVGFHEGDYQGPYKDDNPYSDWGGYPRVAWCCWFVSWCAAQCNAPMPHNYGYVGDMSDWFRAQGRYHSRRSGYIPQPGDLMFQSDQHIGIVTSATRSSFETIEGNYSNSVKRVTRYYSEVTGFGNPAWAS